MILLFSSQGIWVSVGTTDIDVALEFFGADIRRVAVDNCLTSLSPTTNCDDVFQFFLSFRSAKNVHKNMVKDKELVAAVIH